MSFSFMHPCDGCREMFLGVAHRRFCADCKKDRNVVNRKRWEEQRRSRDAGGAVVP